MTLNNTPELSVSALSAAVKHSLETAFGFVRVRGELSKVTLAKSGHLYTTLKDDAASLDAVCWKGTVMRLGLKPEEGMDVVCTGRLTTYPGSSKYQLVIETMELAGLGAILKMLEDRKKKLAAEGLFDAERKRTLPYLPRSIGVITSPTGAVIRDILHRLSDRFPLPVLLWPVTVQGDKAVAEMIAAIEGMNALPVDGAAPLRRPDVIIVARGGGSFEDLMPFQDEALVRAAANSAIPLISAVGHETDVTLIDFAADMRAPTPTAAAEMAVPVRAQLIATLLDVRGRSMAQMQRILEHYQQRLALSRPLLDRPERLLEPHIQRLDRAGLAVTRATEKHLGHAQLRLTTIHGRLRTPADSVALKSQALQHAATRLVAAHQKQQDNRIKRIEQAARILESLSFKKVLARGYSVIQTADGALISQAQQLTSGQHVKIRFHDHAGVDAQIEKL